MTKFDGYWIALRVAWRYYRNNERLDVLRAAWRTFLVMYHVFF